jgi:omega-6 fatty acid desaturase / acyl-lipid omega-6 desaturase (Delta-12 desaturase)
MTQDQVFVPPTRSERGLPPLDLSKEDPLGASVSEEVKKELWEALGDSPIGATLRAASYLVGILLISTILCSPDTLLPDRGMAFIHHP